MDLLTFRHHLPSVAVRTWNDAVLRVRIGATATILETVVYDPAFTAVLVALEITVFVFVIQMADEVLGFLFVRHT